MAIVRNVLAGRIMASRPSSMLIAARSMSSWWQSVEPAAKDPILGVTEAYLADPSPSKVNVGVVSFSSEFLIYSFCYDLCFVSEKNDPTECILGLCIWTDHNFGFETPLFHVLRRRVEPAFFSFISGFFYAGLVLLLLLIC